MKLDKKNIYLIISILILALLSWNLTVKNTLDYKNQYDQLSPDLILQKQKDLQQLKTKNLLLNKGLASRDIDVKTVQTALFEVIENNAYEIKIVDYNNQIGFNTTNERVTYHQIELTGSYNELILSIDLLLQKMGSLKLKNIDFNSKRDFRTRKTSLNVKVILEERGFNKF
jgi:hypothetical protein